MLALLACPGCGGPLTAGADALSCAAEGMRFRMMPSGLTDLRLPETAAAAEAFVAAYRAGRLAEGWRPLSPEVACALPEADPPGYKRLYWPLRRESWRVLGRILEGLGPAPLTVADAGAGFLWSSHRLAHLGHRVVAFDLSADPDFGLGAGRLYPTATSVTRPEQLAQALPPGRFLPVLGDLERPPLARARYDAVICNASLHYVNLLDATLSALGAALQPGSALIVLDSPIAAQGWDTSSRAGEITRGTRVFGRDELDAALRSAGLAPEWIGVRRGRLWARRQVVNWLRGRPGFEFPVIVARKAAERRRGDAGTIR
jgi:SAM-dependent methyltransferase